MTVRSVTGVIAVSGGHDAALGSWPTVGVVAGVTVGIFALIAAAVAATGSRDEARYRPGLSWKAEPVWFNGPDTPAAADAGTRGVLTEGTEPVEAVEAAGTDAIPGVTGGVGGTW